MASASFSSILAAVLLSGLLILGTTEPAEAVCTLMCAQGTYITCASFPEKNFTGCACDECAPAGCAGCVVHLAGGSTLQG